MDTGRLINLLYDIDAEIKKINLSEKLKAFQQAFSQNITQPNQQNSDAFISTRTDLWEMLDKSKCNELPPSYRKMMDKIKASCFFGKGLRQSLEDILSENATTPGQAIEKIAKFNTEAIKFYSLAETTHNNLKNLGVDYDFTSNNEYEIGALFPRDLFKENIEGFGKELQLLDRHLKTFGELVSQDASSSTIRTVTSGSFEVFLNALPTVATVIGEVIEKIVVVYLGILQIRKIREEAKEKKMPNTVIKPMEKYEKETISKEIEKIAEEIFKKYEKSVEKTRVKELQERLKHALEYIAKRLDDGADFEVTPPSEEQEIANDASEEVKKQYEEREVMNKQLRIKGAAFIQLPTREQPILELPEPCNEEVEEEKKTK